MSVSWLSTTTMIRFKLLYFALFAGLGILSPYYPLFFQSQSVTKSGIGVLSMLPNLFSFFLAPVIGFIGDKYNSNDYILMASLIVSTLATTSMLYMHSFSQQLPAVAISAMFRSPVTPQIDSLTMNLLDDKRDYGSIRLWGAVSFGLFSLVGGISTMLDTDQGSTTSSAPYKTQDSFVYIFYINGFANIIAGFILLWIYASESRSKASIDCGVPSKARLSVIAVSSGPSIQRDSQYELVVDTESEEVVMDNTVSSDSLQGGPSISSSLYEVVRTNPSVLLFGMVVFLSGFSSGVIESYLFLFIRELGGNGLVMGIGRFLTCAAEVPVFEVAGQLHQRYGTWVMLTVTQAAFVVRFVYYVTLTKPWFVLPCEVLNGLTFALTWSVSCTYANEIAPANCQSIMQSILQGLHYGIGRYDLRDRFIHCLTTYYT